MINAKKEYTQPVVQAWGTVANVTAVGASRPGGDVRGGSVVPPGHDNILPA
jgi:hypothetical protein